MKKLYRLLLTILLVLAGCSQNSSSTQPISKTDFYFDTVISITLYDSDKAYLIDECFELCEKYEKIFSKTIKTSDISKINSANGATITIDEETSTLISTGLHYSSLTDGYFDITIGGLSELWNFQEKRIPDSKDIEYALQNTNHSYIQVNNNQITISNPNTKIDLGGIAKGYVADKLKEHLLDNGVTNGIIDLGGNVLLIGSKPDNTNYNIGIAKPFGKNSETIAVVRASDKSIVTSGNYQRYFYDEDGNLYHHILNPHTGYPVNNGLNSVTIISDKSIDGDALSTSCFLLGIDEGIKLIEDMEETEAIFIDNKNNITLSSGLTMKDNVISISN